MNQERPQQITVPTEVLQAVVNFLVECPYKEVAHLLAQLNQIAAATPATPDMPNGIEKE